MPRDETMNAGGSSARPPPSPCCWCCCCCCCVSALIVSSSFVSLACAARRFVVHARARVRVERRGCGAAGLAGSSLQNLQRLRCRESGGGATRWCYVQKGGAWAESRRRWAREGALPERVNAIPIQGCRNTLIARIRWGNLRSTRLHGDRGCEYVFAGCRRSRAGHGPATGRRNTGDASAFRVATENSSVLVVRMLIFTWVIYENLNASRPRAFRKARLGSNGASSWPRPILPILRNCTS